MPQKDDFKKMSENPVGASLARFFHSDCHHLVKDLIPIVSNARKSGERMKHNPQYFLLLLLLLLFLWPDWHLQAALPLLETPLTFLWQLLSEAHSSLVGIGPSGNLDRGGFFLYFLHEAPKNNCTPILTPPKSGSPPPPSRS